MDDGDATGFQSLKVRRGNSQRQLYSALHHLDALGIPVGGHSAPDGRLVCLSAYSTSTLVGGLVVWLVGWWRYGWMVLVGWLVWLVFWLVGGLVRLVGGWWFG